MSEVKKKQTPKKNTKKKKKQGKVKRFFKHFFLTLLVLILVGIVVAGGYVLAIIKSAKSLDVNMVLRLNQPSIIYDSDGKFMDDVVDKEQRYVIKLSEMPKNLQNAFVSIEDERFYSHNGIDIKRIAGAAVIDVQRIITRKQGLHGASTLTQQLLKNTILKNEVTINRKVTEIYYALQLEKYLSKDQILEAYLNTIPLGGTVYGVEAAANKYFGIKASQLNLIQCAYIAGTTQSPTYYNALTEASKKDPSRYLKRTKTVLAKMLENNKISKTEYDQAIKDINDGKLKFNPTVSTNRMNFEWFTRPVIDQVKKDLKAKYKYTDDEVSKMIVNGGLRIYSTMDRNLQNATQEILNDNKTYQVGNDLSKNISTEDGHYTYPALQASATIMDYHTGEVKAMVGGRGTQPPGKSNNRAYFDLRPTGSAIKPLTVYAPAIEMKLVTPSTTMEDTKLPDDLLIRNHNVDGNGKPVQIKNQDRQYHGTVTIREALKQSLNVVAARVEDMVGMKNGIAYGKKFGLTFNKNSESAFTAVTLGQFNNDPKDRDGGNSTTMAAAFGAFGNGGTYTQPILYTKVVDASGSTILEKKPETRSVISPEAAYIMYDMLKTPVESGSATSAKFGSIPVAGKTGTSSNNNDMWFAGFTPYLSGSIWLGYDKPSEIYANSSGATCGSIFGKIMAKAHENIQDKSKDIKMPSGVVKGAICIDSGKLATDLCRKDPRGNRVKEDLSIGGSDVSSYCDVHVLAKVNSSNNKLANSNTPAALLVERVFLNKDISKDSPDYKYKLPTEQDDYKAPAETPAAPEETKPAENEDNKDKDKDKDKNNNNAGNSTTPNTGTNSNGNSNNNGAGNNKPTTPTPTTPDKKKN